MKFCPKCGQWKFLEEFYKDNTHSSGYQRRCKSCGKKRKAKHYINNKSHYYDNSKKHRKSRFSKINSLKMNNPCNDCDNVFPFCVMEFDHIDPTTKKFSISDGITRVSMEKLLEEISKCDCICTNCHRLRTYRTFTEKLDNNFSNFVLINKNYVNSLKENNPCLDCGYFYRYFQMDFDHLEDKNFGIAKGVYKKSLKTLKLEIAKCELVCGNCHKIRTYVRDLIDKV